MCPLQYCFHCYIKWLQSDTSIYLNSWRDIYASLFLVKCDAILNRANHWQGEKQTKMTKFCSGICLFFVLICVIWAPMLIYSSGNPTNIANPIIDVSIKIDIKALGGRLTLFKTTACEKIPWKYLKAYNDVDPLGYLGTYNVDDIQLICCQPDASTMWLIPPPVQSRFIQSLEREIPFEKMELILNWDFLRARPKGKELVRYESPIEHCPSVDDVKRVLNGTTNSFNIIDAYPKYFRVTGSGEVRRLEAAIDSCSDLRMRIPYENLPSCDRLLDICEGIYAARAEGELEVEEVLYWTLVNIYRSPHMLLEYTKPD
ncbi:hypothetical protein HU200_047050 [Digitaria exilis]|uniref:Piezo non-specific cation channel R-Ras-binding domain-containing protein n=1 Tax=Digitaria exilis TaxID=1010633 RepID=A0A835EC10_9POAL|nr:hypothetical protein HU200_047050 [Digitaria exilis]